MPKSRRIWTASKKLEIIEYYNKYGMAPTLREFEISNSMLYRWIDKYENYGAEGLKRPVKKETTAIELENNRLKRELKEYKQMLAERDLKLRVQKELLKKK